MLGKLKRLSKAERYVLLAILVFLLIKSLLITNFTANTTEFLQTYRFVFSDSYDWVANGVRLFQNDGITYRSPGLVLLIKLLHGLHLVFLLPIIGNLVFFILLLFLYKLSRQVASEKISLALVGIIALNYSLNLSANSILADMYMITLVAASSYYLITKRYFISFLLLATSILFQDIGYLLMFLWAGYYAFYERESWLKQLRRKNYQYFIRGGLYGLAALLPILTWNVYKFIKFGDPLYSKVAHVELLRINFNSLDFYLFNATSMFGLGVLLVVIFVLFNIKDMLKNRLLVWCLAGLLFNFVFWVLMYEWDDRRFLVYFVPFFFPVFAYFLQAVRRFGRPQLVFVLLLFYTSILPVRTFLSSDEMPLVHNMYLRTSSGEKPRQTLITIEERKGYENPLMNLAPIMYGSVLEYDKNHTAGGTQYAYYIDYVDKNYDSDTQTICIDPKLGTRGYIVNSVMMIERNIDTDDIIVNQDCNAKI